MISSGSAVANDCDLLSSVNVTRLSPVELENIMQTVNIHEAKTQLSRFIDQAESGEEIIIARAGKPVARLVPLQSHANQPRKLGLGKERFSLPDGFDSIDAEQIQAMFEQGA
jgi:prevent-host-death family protein